MRQIITWEQQYPLSLKNALEKEKKDSSEVKNKLQKANKEFEQKLQGNHVWEEVAATTECSSPLPTPEEIIDVINREFEDAIVVTDVGQHQMWVAQYLKMNRNKKLLTSEGLGTMGYGFPAAIGAQFAYPDRQVICISGDGGMQMNIQELATAVSWELPLVICVINNGYLGMVRQVQHLFYQDHYASTCLRFRKSCLGKCKNQGLDTSKCPPYTPDFVKLAESYGANGIRVFHADEIEAAFEKARNNKKGPTLIEFVIEPDHLVLPMVRGGKALNDMITRD